MASMASERYANGKPNERLKKEAEERRRNSLPRTPESAELRTRIAAEREAWTRHVEQGTLEREQRWHEWLLEARRLEAETAQAGEARTYLVAIDDARATMATALDVLAEADAALSEGLTEAELAEQQVRENERTVADAGHTLERGGHHKSAARRKVEAETSLPHLRRRAEVCEETVRTRRESRESALGVAREVHRAQVRRLGLEVFDGVELPAEVGGRSGYSAVQQRRDEAVRDYQAAQRARPFVEKVLGIEPGVLR